MFLPPHVLAPSRAVRLLLLLLAQLALTSRLAEAQAPTPTNWRIGVFFWHESPNDEAAFEGIQSGFESARHAPQFIVRRAHESHEAAAQHLAAFVRDDVDLIFAMGTRAALLAAEHVRELPVVFTAVTDPVGSRVVPSWLGSGSNLAGNSNRIASETLDRVFRLAVPDAKRIGIIRSADCVVAAAELEALRAFEPPAGRPRLEILDGPLEHPATLDATVRTLIERGADAIWVPIDIEVYSRTPEIFGITSALGVPILSSSLHGMRNGATAGIIPNYHLLGSRSVELALSILRDGKAPGDLPIGTLRDYRVVVNLQAARRTSYETPLSLLVLADVIHEDLDHAPRAQPEVEVDPQSDGK